VSIQEVGRELGGLVLEEALLTQGLGVHVDHAAPGDGRRGSHTEVVSLEHAGGLVRHGDDLGVGQTEFLGVVQHGVHALDPE